MMELPRITDGEYRLMLILWEYTPVKSKELVRLCSERLGWKSTTTYTVIKRLSERGIVKNENTVVSALVSKEEVQQSEFEDMFEKTFEGSLPAFLTAFAKARKLSERETESIQKLFDEFAAEQKKGK